MTYRCKPVEIQAIRWTGTNLKEVTDFSEGCTWSSPNGLVINTLEGEMLARVGDYLCRGLGGEYHFCRPDLFEAKYELVEEKPE